MHFDFDKKIPGNVKKILKRLKAAGFEAWIVGGCVRDLLLDKSPADWDITTSARPEEIKGLFKRTLDTGIAHGTVSVLEYEEKKPVTYELTTYRIDGNYGDGRHPDSVSFTGSLSEDLRRRDFTINAMAYAPGDGLVDLFDGQKDLKDGVIRAVGVPAERFSEDALRMMRAIRFAAQLGYRIEDETWKALCLMAQRIENVSAERIQVELDKLLLSKNPSMFRLFYESGLTRYFMPEWDVCMSTAQENPHHCYSVGEHILHSLDALDMEGIERDAAEDARRYLWPLWARLTMLLHDIAKPPCKSIDEDGIAHFYTHPERGAEMAEAILRRLKCSNDTISAVRRLVNWHEWRFEADARSLRRAVSRIGEEYFPLFFYIQEADALAQSTYLREEKLKRIAKLRELYAQLLLDKSPLSMKDLALSGSDLKAAGVPAGPGMGAILKDMLSDVIDSPEHNTKEYLLEHFVYRKN